MDRWMVETKKKTDDFEPLNTFGRSVYVDMCRVLSDYTKKRNKKKKP